MIDFRVGDFVRFRFEPTTAGWSDGVITAEVTEIDDDPFSNNDFEAVAENSDGSFLYAVYEGDAAIVKMSEFSKAVTIGDDVAMEVL